MSYINEDKTFSISCNLSEDNTNGKLLLDICKKANNIIDPLIQSMGYTRIDMRGDRSDIQAPSDTSNYGTYLHVMLNNVYQLNTSDDNFYLICTINAFRYLNSSTSWGTKPWSDNNEKYYFRIFLSYSQTNINSDNFIRTNDIYYKPPDYSFISGQAITSPSVSVTGGATQGIASVIFPMRLITLVNDSNSTIGQFIVNGTNNTNTIPHIGYLHVNGVRTSMISVLSSYATESNITGNKTIQPGSLLSNIMVIEGDTPRRAVSNLISNFSFQNSQQKFPIIPVYVRPSSDSNVYDFNKKINNFYQTSSDYANELGTRYTLNNKNYLSLGNHFLIEEGSV